MAKQDPFEKIAEATIREAELVRCPFAEFVEGLRTIEGEIRSRRELAQEEQRGKEE